MLKQKIISTVFLLAILLFTGLINAYSKSIFNAFVINNNLVSNDKLWIFRETSIGYLFMPGFFNVVISSIFYFLLLSAFKKNRLILSMVSFCLLIYVPLFLLSNPFFNNISTLIDLSTNLICAFIFYLLILLWEKTFYTKSYVNLYQNRRLNISKIIEISLNNVLYIIILSGVYTIASFWYVALTNNIANKNLDLILTQSISQWFVLGIVRNFIALGIFYFISKLFNRKSDFTIVLISFNMLFFLTLLSVTNIQSFAFVLVMEVSINSICGIIFWFLLRSANFIKLLGLKN